MQVRRARHLLWLTTALFMLAGAGGLFTAAWSPLRIAPTEGVERRASTVELAPERPVHDWSRDELRRLSSKPLRRTLFDPPPPPKPAPVRKPLPKLALVGTVLDPDSPTALIREPDGKIRFRKLGDQVGPTDNPVTIRLIERDRVTLEHDGTSLELAMEKRTRS